MQESEACAKARAALDMRNELRGRLEAFKAKARAYGVAEHPALTGIARDAEACLYARPTPLGRAVSLIQAYESRLQQESKR